ncbi:hypothetical protein YSY43_50080 [Paenibacillus sp. YSY-4.3]
MSSKPAAIQSVRTNEQLKPIQEAELLQELKLAGAMKRVKGTVIVQPFSPSPGAKSVMHIQRIEQSKLQQQPRIIQQSKSHEQLNPYQRQEQHQQSKSVGANHPSADGLQMERGHDRFLEWVESYQGALSQYCRSLVGTSWEAEDLAQETWLKVWRISLEKGKNFSINKSYLYRIANHICIDRHRKNRAAAVLYSTDQSETVELQSDEADVDSLWTAMETIVNRLPINQRITLLLMDIFRYTAAETAELLSTTEGAVKALLHRARTKLKSERDGSGGDDGTREEKRADSSNVTMNNEQIVYAYLKAFRENNPRALLMLMNESIAPEQLQPPVLQQRRQQDARYQHGFKAANYSQSLAWAAA